MAITKPASDVLTLLRQSHARIYRISLALCGDRASAEAVVEKVLRMSGKISPRWETDEDARRWFMHYTVLSCRATNAENKNTGSELPRGARPTAEPPGSSSYLSSGVTGNEALLSLVTHPDSIAILRAIRQLPTQQREAFLLHHGEEMDLRQMATAMDCSSAAAANHLVGAVKSLKELHLVGIGEFTARLPALLRQLVPQDDALDAHLQNLIAKRWRRNRIWRIIIWVAWIILLSSIAFSLWWIWTRVEIV
jgi:DNA-directed RNA polymerase specialized sigma24 family protein